MMQGLKGGISGDQPVKSRCPIDYELKVKNEKIMSIKSFQFISNLLLSSSSRM